MLDDVRQIYEKSYNFTLSFSATSEQVTLVPIFLCKKISHLLHCSSFFVKRHARLTCSFVNALTTARCRYHLFTSKPSVWWHLNHSALLSKKEYLLVFFFDYNNSGDSNSERVRSVNKICQWHIFSERVA